MPLTHPPSMQLYSGRKFPPVESQLATLQRHGYTNVETFGPFYDDLAASKRLFDAHGLSVRSVHIAVALAEAEPERAVEIARALDADIVVAPYLLPDLRPTTTEGWKDFGARLARLNDLFGAAGLRFAWHNHDFEFLPLPDGSLPIEHILGDKVLWEADLAWIVRGKADPAEWVERYTGRIPLVHVKDIAPAGENLDEDGWADVGAGTLPWAKLWNLTVEAGAEIMIAEHDNPSDFDRFARVTAEAMRHFAKGVAA